jgi:hypothetical protein
MENMAPDLLSLGRVGINLAVTAIVVLIHTAGAFAILSFIVVHVYMILTEQALQEAEDFPPLADQCSAPPLARTEASLIGKETPA